MRTVRECFTKVEVVTDPVTGKAVTVTETCKERIAALEAELRSALDTLRLYGLSRPDSSAIAPAIILFSQNPCARFFLVHMFHRPTSLETGMCALPKDHQGDCMDKYGRPEVKYTQQRGQ